MVPVAKVYGIGDEVYRCAGCQAVKDIFKIFEIPFEFIEVVFMKDNEVHYNYQAIDEAAKISGVFPSKRVNYPVIKFDGEYMNSLRVLKSTLSDYGYDLDLLD